MVPSAPSASSASSLPVVAADADPWALLAGWLGGPLHPGGRPATRALLEAAEVGAGTRLVDLGCGGGTAVGIARELGADAVGLDARPDAGAASVRGDLASLPFRDAAVDVALAECTLCLARDLEAALAEARRVLAPGGRLAMSDVTLETPVPGLPGPVARLLCLDGARPEAELSRVVERSGLEIVHRRDRTADLVGMRDRLRRSVDVDGLLDALGPRAATARRALRDVEEALDDGRLGYVAMVAERT